jgi:hypothetical protein
VVVEASSLLTQGLERVHLRKTYCLCMFVIVIDACVQMVLTTRAGVSDRCCPSAVYISSDMWLDLPSASMLGLVRGPLIALARERV